MRRGYNGHSRRSWRRTACVWAESHLTAVRLIRKLSAGVFHPGSGSPGVSPGLRKPSSSRDVERKRRSSPRVVARGALLRRGHARPFRPPRSVGEGKSDGMGDPFVRVRR